MAHLSFGEDTCRAIEVTFSWKGWDWIPRCYNPARGEQGNMWCFLGFTLIYCKYRKIPVSYFTPDRSEGFFMYQNESKIYDAYEIGGKRFELETILPRVEAGSSA